MNSNANGNMPELNASGRRDCGCKNELTSDAPKGPAQGVTGVITGASRGERSTDRTRSRVNRRRDFNWFVKRYELPKGAEIPGARKDLAVIADMRRIGDGLAARYARVWQFSPMIDPEDIVGEVLKLASDPRWLNRFRVRRKSKLRSFARSTVHRIMKASLRSKSWLPLFTGDVEQVMDRASVYEQLATQEQVEKIEALVNSLKKGDRKLLGLLESRRPRARKSKPRSDGESATRDLRRFRLRAKLGKKLDIDPSRYTRRPGTGRRKRNRR